MPKTGPVSCRSGPVGLLSAVLEGSLGEHMDAACVAVFGPHAHFFEVLFQLFFRPPFFHILEL